MTRLFLFAVELCSERYFCCT